MKAGLVNISLVLFLDTDSSRKANIMVYDWWLSSNNKRKRSHSGLKNCCVYNNSSSCGASTNNTGETTTEVTTKVRFSASNLTLLGSILVSIIFGIILQLVIAKFLIYTKPLPEVDQFALGNHLFSKPSRQQNIVRFPSDVSYFSSSLSVENNDKKSTSSSNSGAALPPDGAVTSHAALDARTILNVKQKLKAKGKQIRLLFGYYIYKKILFDHGYIIIFLFVYPQDSTLNFC